MVYRQTQNIVKWLCILVLAMGTVFGTFINVHAAEITLPITADQTLKDSSGATENVIFTYRVTPTAAGYPLPEGASGQYDFTLKGNGSKELNFTFDNLGYYEYEVKQITETKKGYQLDEEVYTVKIQVNSLLDQSSNVCVVQRGSDGFKSGSLHFENSYSPLPTDPNKPRNEDGEIDPLLVDPPVRKTVEGKPSADGTFRFKLEAEDKSNPMPKGSSDGVKYMTIKGEGSKDFGTWSYTKAGTYRYTVSEAATDNNDYEYDKTVYTITDVVTDDNGQLIHTRTIKNKTEQVKEYSFVNEYVGDQGGGSKTPWNIKTGDVVRIGLFAAIAVCALIIIIFTVKRKKDE